MKITDEMVEAASYATGYEIHPDDLRAALTAALSAAPAVGVKVKKLEWQTNGDTWWVKGHAPRYEVSPEFPWGVTLHYGTRRISHPGGDYFLSQDHAKAAAQSDYEARILSAITMGELA